MARPRGILLQSYTSTGVLHNTTKYLMMRWKLLIRVYLSDIFARQQQTRLTPCIPTFTSPRSNVLSHQLGLFFFSGGVISFHIANISTLAKATVDNSTFALNLQVTNGNFRK